MIDKPEIGTRRWYTGQRAPVQADYGKGGRIIRPAGTIAWREHEEAWTAYHAKYLDHQDADRIAQRGGFGWDELVKFLGREPETWEER